MFTLIYQFTRRLKSESSSEDTLPTDAMYPEAKRATTIIFLVMRRMRAPLLVLMLMYVLAMLGMMIIPGRDGDGLSIFHSLYFVSYMATTIGFGEIPLEFNDAQRMWVTFCIYLTVVAWIYAIGSLLALVQEDAMRRAVTEQRFSRTVRNIREPFYLICGYGDTGEALVNALEERFLRSVVIEINSKRIDDLTMENYPVYVPRLCADASRPAHLLEGGLKNPYCRAVVSITNDNLVNLHVGITAKLLNPSLKTICRVDADEVAANMASFGTDRIINPFNLFAARLHTGVDAPCLYLLREWLSGRRDCLLSPPLHPPNKGLWIICGYGRFGKAIYRRLREKKGIEIIVIEATLDKTGYPDSDYIIGWGTEARTLHRARIREAVGIVVGTNDDVNNLSIAMTARELNPGLFMILRQNLTSNDPIFNAAQADIIMKPSQIIADHIRVILTTPLLVEFMALAKRRGNQWACELVSRLSGMLAETSPEVWEMELDKKEAPAFCRHIAQEGTEVRMGYLRRDPRDREETLACIPLLLVRGQQKLLLPGDEEILQAGDHILWCGRRYADWWLNWILRDEFVLNYIARGEIQPRGYIWRWLRSKKAR